MLQYIEELRFVAGFFCCFRYATITDRLELCIDHMATLQLLTPFAGSKVFDKSASVSSVRGLQSREAVRVLCLRKEGGEGQSSSGESDGSREAVSILQSSRNPLLNLPRDELMAAFSGKDDVHGDGDSAVGPHLPASGERRRSGRQGGFTAEKARLLRKGNWETQTFHDKWYHSAIASKLASPE